MSRIIKCKTSTNADLYFDIDKVDCITVESHDGARWGTIYFNNLPHPIYVPEKVVGIVMNLKAADDVVPNAPIDVDDVFYDEETGTYNIGKPEGYVDPDESYHQMSIEDLEHLPETE